MNSMTRNPTIPRFSLARLWIVATLALAVPAIAEDADAMYRRAIDLLSPYLVLAESQAADARTAQGRADVGEAIRLLTRVTESSPDYWPAHWLTGKGYQALRDHDSAHAAFARSYAINPNQPDVAREYVIECICIGRTADAVRIADAAVHMDRSDPGLEANLGLALLADGQADRAKDVTESALRKSPDDTITQALLAEINAVRAGRRPSNYCPP